MASPTSVVRMIRVSETPPKKPAMAPRNRPIDERDHRGDDADLEGDPGAVDHPAEHVEADRVGAEVVLHRRGLAERTRGALLGVVGRDPRGEDRGDHEQHEDAEADHGQLVATEPPPHVLAQRPGGGEVGDVADAAAGLDDLQLGAGAGGAVERGHEAPPFPRRMRGSNQA